MRKSVRQYLRETDLKQYTYDIKCFENKVEYAIDEVIKGLIIWMQHQDQDVQIIEQGYCKNYISKKRVLEELEKASTS